MIPTSEQPYPLPGGWQWTQVGLWANILRGVSYKKNDAHHIKQPDDCLILRGGNISEGNIDTTADDNVYVSKDFVAESQLVKQNDIIIVASTGSKKVIGRAGISNQNYSDVSFGAFLMLVRPLSPLLSRYMDYFFQSEFYRNRIRTLAKGTNINNVRTEHLTEMPFPLPPLDEQKRIVTLLDELFADLDEAKALAQAVVDGSKLRRAAILHKAFTGELSKLWRDEHGTSLDSWQRRTVSSVCKSLIYGTSKKSKPSGKIIVLRMGNLQSGEIDWKDLAYSDDEADIKKYLLSKGDVIFNRTNSAELVGKTSIYRGEYPAIYAGYLIKLDYDHDVLRGEYLNYVLNSPAAKEYCNHVKTDGVNQSNINAKKIGAYAIQLPPPEEQKEIVRLLNDLLGRAQRAKDLALKTIERVELMKKSILARAFRGELGINKNLRNI